MVYLLDGELDILTDNGISATMTPHDIAFFPDYHTHGYACRKSSYAYYVQFNVKNFNSLAPIFKSKTLPTILADKEFNKSILKHWEDLRLAFSKEEYVLYPPLTELIVIKLLLHYPHSTRESNRSKHMFIEILRYIDEHYKEKITVDSLAQIFNYNRFYFSKLFNGTLGQSFPQYLAKITVSKVIEEYRRRPNSNISTLAIEHGFNSLSAFYRSFVEICGMPPKNYFRSSSFLSEETPMPHDLNRPNPHNVELYLKTHDKK
jgi:AraC-like DNA-binding protein